MFGGTPANLAVTFVTPQVEVITGVNLPMLIKLARPQKPTDLADARARDARARPQCDLGGVGAAAGREGMTTCDGGDHQRARHARTRGRAIRARRQRLLVAHPRRVRGREMDGKSIMGLLLLAAAQGTTINITADGADEAGAVAR